MRIIHYSLFVPVLLICADLCAAEPAEKPLPLNMLNNPSFEEPDSDAGALPSQWENRSSADQKSGVTKECPKTGGQSLQMNTYGTNGGFQAIVQTVNVQAGSSYSFSLFVKNNSLDPFRGRDNSGAYGQLVVQWFDESGKEVGRVWSSTWDHLLSRLRWSLITLNNAKAPDNAISAVVGVHLYEGSNDALGSFNVDDIAMSMDTP